MITAAIGAIAVSVAAVTLARTASRRIAVTVIHEATGRALLPPVALRHLWPHRRLLAGLLRRRLPGAAPIRLRLRWTAHG